MVTTYQPPRQPTGNRSVDVHNPLFKEAEERVWKWLPNITDKPVRDCRSQNTYHDFIIDDIWAIDVKCDQIASSTGRVAWELYVAKGDNMREGWGRHEHLDYVAFVLPKGKEEPWPLYMVDVPDTQKLIERIDNGLVTPEAGEYVPFNKVGTDRTGIGIAISLELLRRENCVMEEAHV